MALEGVRLRELLIADLTIDLGSVVFHRGLLSCLGYHAETTPLIRETFRVGQSPVPLRRG